MSGRIMVADGPEGELFACVDPSARFVEASVARTKLAAALHPFQFEERAKAALLMAGATAGSVREWRR